MTYPVKSEKPFLKRSVREILNDAYGLNIGESIRVYDIEIKFNDVIPEALNFPTLDALVQSSLSEEKKFKIIVLVFYAYPEHRPLVSERFNDVLLSTTDRQTGKKMRLVTISLLIELIKLGAVSGKALDSERIEYLSLQEILTESSVPDFLRHCTDTGSFDFCDFISYMNGREDAYFLLHCLIKAIGVYQISLTELMITLVILIRNVSDRELYFESWFLNSLNPLSEHVSRTHEYRRYKKHFANAEDARSKHFERALQIKDWSPSVVRGLIYAITETPDDEAIFTGLVMEHVMLSMTLFSAKNQWRYGDVLSILKTGFIRPVKHPKILEELRESVSSLVTSEGKISDCYMDQLSEVAYRLQCSIIDFFSPIVKHKIKTGDIKTAMHYPNMSLLRMLGKLALEDGGVFVPNKNIMKRFNPATVRRDMGWIWNSVPLWRRIEWRFRYLINA